MDTSTGGARLVPMSDETRGHAIKRRRELLGIFSGYEFERASERVGILVRRALLGKAESGAASDASYVKIETVLDRLEEEMGQENGTSKPQPDDVVEFRLSGNFGVDVVVKGPVSDMPELEGAVARLIREMRDRND